MCLPGKRPQLPPAALDRASPAAEMALSKLSGDEQGIILGQLCNTLEPRRAVHFSSACTELRVLLTPAVRQQLRADHEAAAALCVMVAMRSCKELREATEVVLDDKGLSEADLATLGTLGSVLPALEELRLHQGSGSAGSAGPDGVPRLAEGLAAGALPAVVYLGIYGLHMGLAGASALAGALGRGALPRLQTLHLVNAAIGGAGLVALAPALRRRPTLAHLDLSGNSLGDEGITALVAPPPPAGALPPPAGGLKRLKTLDLRNTHVTDAGCATITSAIDSGALPALKVLRLDGIAASASAN